MSLVTNIEFKKVVIPDEMDALRDFDQKIFGDYPDDLFSPEEWGGLESYWVLMNGVPVGCIALEHDIDFDGEPKPGSLFIASTGLLPDYQGRGYGSTIKEWEIDYGRRHGFKLIVTNARESNTRSIRLNEKFGFKVRETALGYYSNPKESATVMQLQVGAAE
jgi:ribosomal protein S18 acetylase RimI-like enzyme